MEINLKKAALGVEFGSTRIKAVLIGEDHAPLAQGDFVWENKLENGVWTYGQDEILAGLQAAYAVLDADVERQFGCHITTVGAIGISAMMHGYLAFDKDGALLVPFRTWRNTITGQAAAELTEAFGFNIPQRWSIAHLYQAILRGEEHLPELCHFTTLAGYVHELLTGRKVLGIGDAAGMFPIDSATRDYDAAMMKKFDELTAVHGFNKPLASLLPQAICAGGDAGVLTEAGAKLLDPSGRLEAGIPLCPPEGDAGTGMVATNAIAPRTGNVSAGTSIFAMVVLEKPLTAVHEEIDLVTTPVGDAVAMVHCNNCTSDMNAWVGLFDEVLKLCGTQVNRGELFTKLFNKSLEGAADCAGIAPINYFSGEGVTHLDAGVPLLMRTPDGGFGLANLMRANIYSAVATLTMGLNILHTEQVKMDSLMGHGGLFKTPGVAQSYLAAAAHTPVTVMSTAGEGGAWGAALLAAYRRAVAEGCTMEMSEYLNKNVFAGMPTSTIAPDAAIEAGFEAFMKRYEIALGAERAAIAAL